MKEPRRFPTFHVDDSSCEIAGRKHVILAGISYNDEDSVIAEWLDLKKKYDLLPNNEVKWNSRQLPIEVRREFIPVAAHGTGIVVVSDIGGKQAAALRLASQASLYCEESGYAGYRLRLDQNIISDWQALENHCLTLSRCCVGMSEADSRREQLLQCADFLAGAIKLGISFGTGRLDRNEKIKLPTDAGADGGASDDVEECELGFFLFASLRYCLWGETVETSNIPDQYLPVKTTYGRGIVVKSSLPEKTIADAMGDVDGFYMGCIH